MKALSVKQPWAELIARGEKTLASRQNTLIIMLPLEA